MRYGKPGERPGTDREIARVGLPTGDPVRGGARRDRGPLASEVTASGASHPKSLGRPSA